MAARLAQKVVKHRKDIAEMSDLVQILGSHRCFFSAELLEKSGVGWDGPDLARKSGLSKEVGLGQTSISGFFKTRNNHFGGFNKLTSTSPSDFCLSNQHTLTKPTS